MKNTKKLPVQQLEKFSNIFTQLGLVLVLFIVYITLEHQTEQKSVAIYNTNKEKVVYVAPNTQISFTRVPKEIPKITDYKPQVLIIDEPIKKGDNTITEVSFIDEPQKEPTLIDINSLVVAKEPDDNFIEDVDFINIEDAPVFKGCEGLSKSENKNCFNLKMQQFIQRNFDVDLANQLGLTHGKYKIYTQFVIDNKGFITDLKVRAPHKTLKKEANRIIKKLPKFTPGKQRNKPVKVKYALPIAFNIE
jgi:protein TonB